MLKHELQQPNSSVDIESVLAEAIYLIEEASEGQEITSEDLRSAYNRHCDTQVRLTPLEYQLALAIASGEVALQEGGNIKRAAATDNVKSLLWQAQDDLGVGV